MVLATLKRVSLIYLVILNFSPTQQCIIGFDYSHCSCNDDYGLKLECTDIYAPAQFFQVISSLYDEKMIVELKFYNSKLRFWPSDIFKGIEFKVLLLNSCEILTFGEGNGCDGYDESVKRLITENTNLIEEEKWKLNVACLKTLTTLKITTNTIPKLAQSLASESLPESLRELLLYHCGIEEIEAGFLSTLKKLEVLRLKGNNIKNLPDNLSPLPELITLDLANNKLQQLPENMVDMFPNLSELNLLRNDIYYLPESLWSDILGKLHYLSLPDNTLRCEASMKWIVDARKPEMFQKAQCAAPEKLQGKRLIDLTSADFDP